MMRALGIVIIGLLAIGCSKPAPEPTTCTCVPNNASRVGYVDVLGKLRRHVRDVAAGRNARDVKVDDDELRFAIANYCDPCNAWVTDRMTIDEMYPLARLDDATGAVCMGLVLRDRTTVYGDVRPTACR